MFLKFNLYAWMEVSIMVENWSIETNPENKLGRK